ncbi:MAG: transcriptional regulator [Bacteroidetes bacterium]|nr:transcriptional regulator [Bacteroidota bacterium]
MPGLSLFPSGTKRDLLLLIKHRGSISLDDAEESIGLTRTTLREHLGVLERDGLVARTSNRYGRGRPSMVYSLTSEAESLFPSRDHELLGSLLAFLDAAGRADLIDTFFREYWSNRQADMTLRTAALRPADHEGRVRVLSVLLEEQGFMPKISSDENGIVVRECNCPFPEAVKQTRLPCRLEAAFLAHILETPVKRVSYIPDGAAACTYEFALANP